MSEYRLHCFAQSGNAYKAALMLALGRRRLGAGLRRLLQRRHPHARLPRASTRWARRRCWSTAAIRLTQSGVILDYLAETLGRLRPGDARRERREILRWTLWDNHKLTSYIATLRFLIELRAGGEARRRRHRLARRPPARRAEGAGRAIWPTATGSPPTASTTADLSCVGYLYFTDEFGLDIADFPNIDRWRERHRRAARLAAPLRPDARPPDPRPYLRSRP